MSMLTVDAADLSVHTSTYHTWNFHNFTHVCDHPRSITDHRLWYFVGGWVYRYVTYAVHLDTLLLCDALHTTDKNMLVKLKLFFLTRVFGW